MTMQICLTSPHPRSYFAFEQAVKAVFDQYDGLMASWPAASADRSDDPVAHYYARTHDDLRASIAEKKRTELEELIPCARLNSPEVQAFVREHCDLVLAYHFLFSENAALRRREGQPKSGAGRRPKPERQAAVDIAVGAYLSLPEDGRTRSAAADMLNRGIPKMSEASGIRDDHIRNALDTFAKEAFHLSRRDERSLYARSLVLFSEAKVRDALWSRAVAWRAGKPAEADDLVEALLQSGNLFAWREEIEGALFLGDGPERACATALGLVIRMLEDVQRRAA